MLWNDIFCVKLSKQWRCFMAKKKKLGGASSSSPTRQPPALHPPTHQHPQPSILEAEKLLCASLAPSKCTVFLENYSRKFASQLGDAAAAHVHLCSGTCPCVFGGGAVVYEGSSSCLTYQNACCVQTLLFLL